MKIASPFPAILLAGGFGTRLRDAVPDLPKPLATVRGRPFITYLLDQLVDAGFTQVIIGLHYHAEKMIDVLGSNYRSLRLDYSVEKEPLGTGGALRLAAGQAEAERVLVMNADSICAISLRTFISFHLAHAAPASLVSLEVPDTSRFGLLTIADDGRVLAVVEKTGASLPGAINGGIYLVEKELIHDIPPGRPVSLEREVFPGWIERGLFAWRTRAPFIDIGLPESYAQAQSLETLFTVETRRVE